MKKLYAIYDKAAMAYSIVLQAPHDAVVVRDFAAVVGDERTTVAKFPKEFALHEVGVFLDSNQLDDVTAAQPRVIATVPPRVVAEAADIAAMNVPSEPQNVAGGLNGARV